MARSINVIVTVANTPSDMKVERYPVGGWRVAEEQPKPLLSLGCGALRPWRNPMAARHLTTITVRHPANPSAIPLNAGNRWGRKRSELHPPPATSATGSNTTTR